MKYTSKLLFLLCFVMTFSSSVMAQIQVGNDMSEIDYTLPRDYEIGGSLEEKIIIFEKVQ